MPIYEEDSPSSGQEEATMLEDAQTSHKTAITGLQSEHPVLSIRTNNLTPTPMFTSAFTTTPLSTYPPLTPQSNPTPAALNLVGGGTPGHSIDELSVTSLSSQPGLHNGTQLQQGKLKRKLDRFSDQQEDAGEGQHKQQPQKRTTPNSRKQSSSSTLNET